MPRKPKSNMVRIRVTPHDRDMWEDAADDYARANGLQIGALSAWVRRVCNEAARRQRRREEQRRAAGQ